VCARCGCGGAGARGSQVGEPNTIARARIGLTSWLGKQGSHARWQYDRAGPHEVTKTKEKGKRMEWAVWDEKWSWVVQEIGPS
jgi:hypothetical protein